MSGLALAKKNAKEINQIRQIYLTNLGVSDIAYNYYTAKGDRSVLASNEQLLDAAFGPNRFAKNKQWPSSVKIKRGEWHVPEMLYTQVPDEAADFMQSMRAHLGSTLNSFGVISVFQRVGNDLESIEFFADNIHEGFRLMNHVDDLQRFMLLFKDQTRSLRANVLKNPILKSRDVTLFEPSNLNPKLPNFDVNRYYLNDGKTHLSRREAECVSLLLQCRSSREISEALGISSRTVESHVQSVKTKLDCSKQSELHDVLHQLGFRLDLVQVS